MQWKAIRIDKSMLAALSTYIVMTIIRGVFNGGEAPGRFPPLDVMRFFAFTVYKVLNLVC